eukprot:PLAT14762.1.p1 GENE.PLAT14762.1~~PLAT14762.1.p1  ORF type:complete len:414 (-),score=75.58 PLAT14762.1:89-1330(-)
MRLHAVLRGAAFDTRLSSLHSTPRSAALDAATASHAWCALCSMNYARKLAFSRELWARTSPAAAAEPPTPSSTPPPAAAPATASPRPPVQSISAEASTRRRLSASMRLCSSRLLTEAKPPSTAASSRRRRVRKGRRLVESLQRQERARVLLPDSAVVSFTDSGRPVVRRNRTTAPSIYLSSHAYDSRGMPARRQLPSLASVRAPSIRVEHSTVGLEQLVSFRLATQMRRAAETPGGAGSILYARTERERKEQEDAPASGSAADGSAAALPQPSFTDGDLPPPPTEAASHSALDDMLTSLGVVTVVEEGEDDEEGDAEAVKELAAAAVSGLLSVPSSRAVEKADGTAEGSSALLKTSSMATVTVSGLPSAHEPQAAVAEALPQLVRAGDHCPMCSHRFAAAGGGGLLPVSLLWD